MARQKKKEDMSIAELEAAIAKLKQDIDADTILLNDRKAAYETEKFRLVGQLVFSEMKKFNGNYFSLTPEILCKRLSDTFTKKGEKKIVSLIYSELGIKEKKE